MTDKIKFNASLDFLAKCITVGSIILLLIIVAISFNEMKENPFEIKQILAGFSGILILFFTVLFCYLFAPKGYIISDHYFEIMRIVGAKKINLNEIVFIRKVNDNELKGAWRTFGVGGLFGYFGYFRNSTLGNMNWQVTQRKNFVLIQLKNEKITIFSPDLPDELIDEVAQKISSQNGNVV